MLVLSRRESERIRLGDSIVVTVIRVVGDRVRLGIDAPSDVLVLRDELEARPDERPLTIATELSPSSGEVAESSQP
jgi:carbon storage regulator